MPSAAATWEIVIPSPSCLPSTPRARESGLGILLLAGGAVCGQHCSGSMQAWRQYPCRPALRPPHACPRLLQRPRRPGLPKPEGPGLCCTCTVQPRHRHLELLGQGQLPLHWPCVAAVVERRWRRWRQLWRRLSARPSPRPALCLCVPRGAPVPSAFPPNQPHSAGRPRCPLCLFHDWWRNSHTFLASHLASPLPDAAAAPVLLPASKRILLYTRRAAPTITSSSS